MTRAQRLGGLVVAVGLAIAGAVAPPAGLVQAQDDLLPPPPNENNCAGDTTAFTARVAPVLFGIPLGRLLKPLAQLQGVDDLDYASCGNTHRQNQ
jgi:hypothetical protein